MPERNAVLTYWFGDAPGGLRSIGARVQWWFEADPDVDRETRDRFVRLLKRAHGGDLANWERNPSDRLALILLLDQFSRRIHRGTPNAYRGEATATLLAVEGLRMGMDLGLTVPERVFFSMPLGHAEDRRLQRLHLRYAEQLPDSDWKHVRFLLDATVGHARRNFNTIARFGRFPQRNAILGRQSTPDELAFVAALGRRSSWIEHRK